jgi:hypothetical protein
VSKQNPRNLGISLLLLGAVLVGVAQVECDAATTTLRTELEDLQEMKSRLLVDFPAGLYGPRRFLYVENRKTFEYDSSGCGCSDREDSRRGARDPFWKPQQWAVGFSSPLFTAGPISLRGVLAQLYNPLAHGPASDVFSEPPDLSLNIDLDVAARRGAQLSLIPGHWSLLCMYERQIGSQFGSAIAIPVGRSLNLTLTGLLSSPPDRLEQEGTWYAGGFPFPGGLITHMAGSLTWEHDPLRLTLVAAASAGRLVRPGTFFTFDMSLSAALADLSLLFGFCSPRFFTPEGDTGDLEWIGAARAERVFGPFQLSAAWSKELCPLHPFPEAFRGGRDRFDCRIQIVRGSAPRRVWSIGGEAGLQREWSAEGRENTLRRLETESTLDWRAWKFAAGMSELRDGESETVRDVRVRLGHDPEWGKIELEAGYRLGPIPGFDLTASFNVTGEKKRFYIRVGTKEVVPAGDWLELFTLRLGWEASREASTVWQFQRQTP